MQKRLVRHPRCQWWVDPENGGFVLFDPVQGLIRRAGRPEIAALTWAGRGSQGGDDRPPTDVLDRLRAEGLLREVEAGRHA